MTNHVPPDLTKRWGVDPEKAFAALIENFRIIDGNMIRPKFMGRDPTEQESSAIDYLLMAWDYGYNREPEPGVRG